jgi:RNA polymerase sigma-70 factor (ECF subfamily)
MATRGAKKNEGEEASERASGVWEKEDTPRVLDVRVELAAFFRAEEALLLRWLVLRVPEQVAFDLRGTAFLVLAKYAQEKKEMPAKPAGFLYGVAENLVREHRREQQALEEHDGGDEVDTLPRSLGNPEQAMLRAQNRRLVEEVLAELPEEAAWWIRAVELDGVAPGEAAALRGIDENTGRKRLERARKRFAELARKKERGR